MKKRRKRGLEHTKTENHPFTHTCVHKGQQESLKETKELYSSQKTIKRALVTPYLTTTILIVNGLNSSPKGIEELDGHICKNQLCTAYKTLLLVLMTQIDSKKRGEK